MTAELNRIGEQATTDDFTDGPAIAPTRTAMDDWIESDADPSRPRLVQKPRNRVVALPQATGGPNQSTGTATPLLADAAIGELRSRWSNIQAGFVDEPRRSVQDADKLVATAMQRLAEGFANERASIEKQWDSGDAVSTEDLRVALQRYRDFFMRLLNAAA